MEPLFLNNGDHIIWCGPGWYCNSVYPDCVVWSMQGEDKNNKPYEDAVWYDKKNTTSI